jgi:hypothetical protein
LFWLVFKYHLEQENGRVSTMLHGSKVKVKAANLRIKLTRKKLSFFKVLLCLEKEFIIQTLLALSFAVNLCGIVNPRSRAKFKGIFS